MSYICKKNEKRNYIQFFSLMLFEIVIMLEKVKGQYNYFVSRILTDSTIDTFKRNNYLLGLKDISCK